MLDPLVASPTVMPLSSERATGFLGLGLPLPRASSPSAFRSSACCGLLASYHERTRRMRNAAGPADRQLGLSDVARDAKPPAVDAPGSPPGAAERYLLDGSPPHDRRLAGCLPGH